jgi:hypothetical protein
VNSTARMEDSMHELGTEPRHPHAVIAYEYTLHGNTYHSVETASLSISRLTRLEISAHARSEFSNRSTDARDPCNIDPLDRAGAARLTGMDQDRDRGTTTRDGITKGSPKGHPLTSTSTVFALHGRKIPRLIFPVSH